MATTTAAAAVARRRCCLWLILPLLPMLCPGLLLVVAAEQVALVEVFVEQRPGVSALLQGEVVEPSAGSWSSEHRDEDGEELEGELVLVSVAQICNGSIEHISETSELNVCLLLNIRLI